MKLIVYSAIPIINQRETQLPPANTTSKLLEDAVYEET